MIRTQLLFWGLVSLVVYHHAVYPVLLRMLARRKMAVIPEAATVATGYSPTVTLIVPAHNESNVIARKIANLMALDYPAEKLNVIISCDGCTDDTASIARQLTGDRRGWEVRERQRNIGKIVVLNEEIASAKTDIIALSDASALLDPDVLKIAAQHFADPGVGVVCGTYALGPHAAAPDRDYWRYQTAIKLAEAALAAPIGAHGAFYLFRKGPWQALAPDTINDDVILPMSIVMKGFRCVYDTRIVARELETSNARADFRRRVRIGAGNLQQAIRLAPLANPARGWLAFSFISGKFLRAMMPFILAALLLLLTALATSGYLIYQAALILVGLMVIAAIAVPAPNRVMLFLAGYAASGIGALLLLTGRGSTVWQMSSVFNRSRR